MLKYSSVFLAIVCVIIHSSIMLINYGEKLKTKILHSNYSVMTAQVNAILNLIAFFLKHNAELVIYRNRGWC